MEISITVVRGDAEPLRAKFEEAGLAFEVEERRNFDGFIPTLSFIFDTVGNFSSLVLPFVIYYMERHRGAEVELNQRKISDLSPDEIRRLVAELERDASGGAPPP